MFIERSAGRIRLTRLIFVVAGLVPCLLLAGWAVHRGSTAHRDAVRAAWQAAVGLPLDVAAITHPRPGVLSSRNIDHPCVLRPGGPRPRAGSRTPESPAVRRRATRISVAVRRSPFSSSHVRSTLGTRRPGSVSQYISVSWLLGDASLVFFTRFRLDHAHG
jgi:hypothetical protein